METDISLDELVARMQRDDSIQKKIACAREHFDRALRELGVPESVIQAGRDGDPARSRSE